MKTKLTLLISALALGGCSIPVSYVDHEVTVTCQANDPLISVNGESRYTNHFETTIERGKDMYVTCSDEGYQTQSRKIDRSLSVAGALDTMGTFLFIFPVFGLFSDGSMALEETEVHLALPKDRPVVVQTVTPQQVVPQSIIINNN